MVAVTKFSFDQVFDSIVEPSGHDRDEEAPPPEPVFTADDLAAARDRGFSEGRLAGVAEAEKSVENAAATALAQIGEVLAALAPVVGETAQRCRQDAIGIARAIARKMVDRSVHDSATAAIEGLIAKILPRVIDEPRVVIRVSDELLDPLQQRLSHLSAGCGFPGSLILLAEHGLARPDCRIEWSDGGAEYDYEKIWNGIDTIIEQYCAEISAAERGPGDPVTGFAPAEQTNSKEHADG